GHSISAGVLPGGARSRRGVGDPFACLLDLRGCHAHERAAGRPGAQRRTRRGHTHVRRLLPIGGRARRYPAQPVRGLAVRGHSLARAWRRLARGWPANRGLDISWVVTNNGLFTRKMPFVTALCPI